MKDSLYEYSLPELKAGIASSSECIAHMHIHFEILYVRKGVIPVMISGIVYTLFPGDCAVIFPGVLHNHMNASEGNEMFMAVCSPHFAGQYEEILKQDYADMPVLRKSALHKNAAILLDSLTELLNARTDFTEYLSQITTSSFQLFFAYVLPELHLRDRNDSDWSELTQRVMQYITQNIKRKLTIEIISKELGISKYKISKIFANELQMNFNQYLNQLRINNAKKLLTTTNNSVTTICFESGFSAVRTFNTVFFQIVGISPTEYRQQYLHGKLEHKYDFYLNPPSDTI